jgi:hypothetical protein
MPHIIENQKEDFIISTDPAKLDIDAIADMLRRATGHKGVHA